MKTVFVIDDSGYMRSLIKNTLEKAGYQIVGEAGSGELAIDLCIGLRPDLITLDNILPDMHGLDILKAIRGEGVDSKVIMVSALGQASIVEEAIQLGALDYVVKPFESEDLIRAVSKMFVSNKV
ncbi:MAG: response regulator [Reichenbachiella sp.]|uniref:response regulator n=1 Tax=Reichenbachiella sp. TaxID=2184521 RepID=UPI003265C1E4